MILLSANQKDGQEPGEEEGRRGENGEDLTMLMDEGAGGSEHGSGRMRFSPANLALKA